MDYHAFVSSITVKPVGQKIFSDMATEICIVDEGAGPYIKIVQINNQGDGVEIDRESWPHIKRSVDKLFDEMAEPVIATSEI